MEQGRPQDMNGNVQVSQSQPNIHSLSAKQRVFIAVLLLLGLLLSFVVVRFLDPAAALTDHASSSAPHSTAEAAVAGRNAAIVGRNLPVIGHEVVVLA